MSDFNPAYSKGSYSAKDALAFATACDLTYQIKHEPHLVISTLKEWGFVDITIINKCLGGKIDTQGFVAANDQHILVAFSGSECFNDWWTNITFVSETGPFPGTKVHKGFQDALVPTLVVIASNVQKFNLRGEKEIWLTGHSLGGALASLLAAMLLADDFEVAALYTYGAPRVGDTRFEKIFNEKFQAAYRVVNQDDVVPHLPPEFLGFSHNGSRILFDRDGRRSSEKNRWVEFQEKMGAWLSHIPQSGIQIKGPHLLKSEEGYLKKLKNDLIDFLQ